MKYNAKTLDREIHHTKNAESINSDLGTRAEHGQHAHHDRDASKNRVEDIMRQLCRPES